MLTTKLEDLMFAMFSLMSSCFGKGMLSVCCCTLEARNFFFFLFNTCSQLRGGLESQKKLFSFEVYWDDCRPWLFR